MADLMRFNPPGYMSDYQSIPGQLEAWHQAMSGWFDAIVAIQRQAAGAPTQYFNAANFDPGGIQVEQAATWNAFPKELVRRYGRETALRLADNLFPIERYGLPSPDPLNPAGTAGLMYRPQEEYCEWRVERDPLSQKIQRITFTSEPPEYWQALAGLVPGGGDIPDAQFPGSPKTLLRLYHELVSPEVRLEDLMASHDLVDANGTTWVNKGQYNIYNKWNTTHGLAHLNSPPNSLVAEVQLGGDASLLYNNPQGRLLVEPDALIAFAGFGGPNRNSDPTIGSTVNALARLGAYLTLKDPVGLYMDHIDLSGWQAPDGGNVSDFVRVVRGIPGLIERMVIEAPPGRGLEVGDLTIGGIPIRFGGQAAECITVKLVGVAHIVVPPVNAQAVSARVRSPIDPNYPKVIGRGGSSSVPLPPGTIEAFIGQGSLPIHGTHQGLAASDRVVATASATTEGVAANVMRLSKRPLNRTR